MADVKITDLPAASSVTPGVDVLPLVTGGGATTSKATPNQVVNAVLSASPTITSPTLVTPLLGTPVSGNFSSGTFTWPTFNQSTSGNAGTATTAVNLSGTQTANYFYAAPNGSSGAGSWRAIVAADIPTLNQDTSGSAGSVVGSATITSGTIDNTAIGGTTRSTLASTTELVGPSASANFTRFPNALAVVSQTAAGIQQNESHNIGLISEGVANSGDANIWGVGVYGVGYTNVGTRCGGVVGEGHVSASGDTAAAVGVRGYANDTHAGGVNIGLYGTASNSSTGNYALYMLSGNIFSNNAQTWYLNGGDLTFSGAYVIAPVIKTTVYSAAGTPLPSASTAGTGARAFVSDATDPAFGAAYASGGTHKRPVFSDGSSWYVG